MNTFVAALCYLLAAAAAAVTVGLSAGLVAEYGPAEGYGNLALQVLPIAVPGLLLAGGLVWVGNRVRRRHVR